MSGKFKTDYVTVSVQLTWREGRDTADPVSTINFKKIPLVDNLDVNSR